MSMLPLAMIDQREIEAGIAGPLIRAFAAEFGTEATLAIVERVVTEAAHASGRRWAELTGGTDLERFARILDRWQENDALEITILRSDAEALEFNVTRCRYAEMYHRLGLGDLGGVLSCARDGALAVGFDPSIRLTRTQTIMQGATHCDFRFRVEPSKE